MADYLGRILVPEVIPSGTFPIVPDYGYGHSLERPIAIHQFGSANAKIEQRFLLGNGARRFTVRRAALNESHRVALRDFWEQKYGPYGAFTYNAPNDDGNGTTPYTCRFAEEPLSWEFLCDAVSSVGVTLIEIPASSPTYALNETLTRFPNDNLKPNLLVQIQEMIPLVKIQPREADYPALYVSDRRLTLGLVGPQVYQARLLTWDGISQSIGNESDQAQFTFGNADRVMRDLSADTDLYRAPIEFSLFHVAQGVKVDLWKGEIVDWQFDEGPEFRVTAADGIYELNLPYPTRKISRSCWKSYNDGLGCPFTGHGAMDLVNYPNGDPTKCDKGYRSDNGCCAHGMKRYFGGVIAEPQGVRIKDNSTGVWGFGRSSITSVSLIAESIYDQVIPEIYTDSDMPVNAKIAAGREESDFYNALGLVAEGPLSFGSGHKLDGQLHHGYPGTAGYRYSQGFDPALEADSFSLGPQYKDNFSAGVAFIELKRSDTPGLQLTQVSGHDMQAVVSNGLTGWVWSAPGIREQQVLTNPVWIVINMLLRARGLRFASAAVCEEYFDVQAAIAAAWICNQSVTKMIGSGTETQFKFRGILQEEKPLRDWMQEILMNCLGYYTFAFGKLKVGIRSNSSTIEPFTEGNILFQSLQLGTTRPQFNHLTANFADGEFEFATNSLTVYDIDHAKFVGGATAPLYLKSQMNLSGTASKSQAARLVTTRLREELGGITAAQWKAARQVSFKTTVLALNVDPGMVCSMTHPNMPGGHGEFRVTGWRLNGDFSIDITGKTTVDEMYDMVVGPKPVDVEADPLPVEPPYWNQRATGGKATDGVGNVSGNPTLTEMFIQDDVNRDLYRRKIKVEFTPPPTTYKEFTKRASISSAAVLALGGSIPGDQVLCVEVCARADGVDGLSSDPLQIVIPGGTNTNKFTFQCLLPEGATHYVVRVGPSLGRMYLCGAETASPGTDPFTVSVTDISALNSASLSPDPGFDHVRLFYSYNGSAGNIREAGTTKTPSESEFVFEPEAPEADDTEITVVLCSENRDRSDRYPYALAPSATIPVTQDSGNPSGAHDLVILQHSDDATIPEGYFVAQWHRDTQNFRTIYAVELYLSTSLPAQGPCHVERDAHPTSVIETGVCTVTAKSKDITVTRAANPEAYGRPIVIFTDDSEPDDDLDGNVIDGEGLNYLHVSNPFVKTGLVNYAILKRWWQTDGVESTNSWEHTYWVERGELANNSLEDEVWRTIPLPAPNGTFYATLMSRNAFGVGKEIS